MQTEHMRRWILKDQDEENPDATSWLRVVYLVHAAFRGSHLYEEATWQAVIVIPKRGRDFWGVGLVEVLWIMVTVILDLRLGTSITSHGVLHGFHVGCEIGNSSLNSNLL